MGPPDEKAHQTDERASDENLWGGPVPAPEREPEHGPEPEHEGTAPQEAATEDATAGHAQPDSADRGERSVPADRDRIAPAGRTVAEPWPPAAAEPAADADEPDLAPAALQAWRKLLAAHALVVREVERRLREAGLPSLSWYEPLSALDAAPARRLRHHELADAIVLSRSGLSRLLDRLEAEGLIERQSCAEDRRGAHVVLTEAGVGVLRRMWPVYSAALAEHFAAPVGAYAAGVRDALRAVSDRLRAGADGGAARR